MTINNNLALTDISALSSVDLSGMSGLNISNNIQLAVCSNPAICTYLSGGGAATIANNTGDCAGVIQVLDDCSGFYYFIASSGYWDDTSNWSGGLVPDANSFVIILAGNHCMIKSNYSAECRIFEIELSGEIDCPSSSQLTVHGN